MCRQSGAVLRAAADLHSKKVARSSQLPLTPVTPSSGTKRGMIDFGHLLRMVAGSIGGLWGGLFARRGGADATSVHFTFPRGPVWSHHQVCVLWRPFYHLHDRSAGCRTCTDIELLSGMECLLVVDFLLKTNQNFYCTVMQSSVGRERHSIYYSGADYTPD